MVGVTGAQLSPRVKSLLDPLPRCGLWIMLFTFFVAGARLVLAQNPLDLPSEVPCLRY